MTEPAASFAVTRFGPASVWTVGRAGMRYRDLIPDRLGGFAVASHIEVPGGGPVPDWVHWHDVRFQTIYCWTGEARVVYEDQGEPFWMRPGDCVLQPPGIRHRVLECAPGFAVIEVTSPAEHATHADEELALPTPALSPEREFGGQRFVHHGAAKARWRPWRLEGFECRDTGIGDATCGLGDVRIVRPCGGARSCTWRPEREVHVLFVLQGELTLRAGCPERLVAGDCAVLFGSVQGMSCSAELRLLEVSLRRV